MSGMVDDIEEFKNDNEFLGINILRYSSKIYEVE